MKDKFSKLEKLIMLLLIKLKQNHQILYTLTDFQVIEAQVKKIIAITRGK